MNSVLVKCNKVKSNKTRCACAWKQTGQFFIQHPKGFLVQMDLLCQCSNKQHHSVLLSAPWAHHSQESGHWQYEPPPARQECGHNCSKAEPFRTISRHILTVPKETLGLLDASTVGWEIFSQSLSFLFISNRNPVQTSYKVSLTQLRNPCCCIELKLSCLACPKLSRVPALLGNWPVQPSIVPVFNPVPTQSVPLQIRDWPQGRSTSPCLFHSPPPQLDCTASEMNHHFHSGQWHGRPLSERHRSNVLLQQEI